MNTEPWQDMRDPDRWHLNGKSFSLRAALVRGHHRHEWARIEDFCGVPYGMLWQWWEIRRPKSWQEQLCEALADSNRAQQRKAESIAGGG